MINRLFLLAGLLLTLFQMEVLAQSSHFVLCGKAVNLPENDRTFSLAVTHPYRNEGYTIQVNPDGTFRQSIPVAGTIQEVYLYLGGDAITVFTYPGDTIRLEFDNADLPASLQAKGNSLVRSDELGLSMELHRKFRQRYLKMNKEYYRTSGKGGAGQDSLFHSVISYIKDARQCVDDYLKTHGQLPHEDYFHYKAYFQALTLLAGNPQQLREASRQVTLYSDRKGRTQPYMDASFDFFTSPDALLFAHSYLSNAIRQATQLFNYPIEERLLKQVELTRTLIPNARLRDWFLASNIFISAGYISTDFAYRMGEQLLNDLTDADAKSFIDKQMTEKLRPFLPGKPAPDLTLTDRDGKEFSLRSLRGKYVYIDIWGVGCGACMMEFRHLERLHQKYEAYKDRMAFLYVCAYGNANGWRKTAEKYKLHDYGISLYADAAHQSEAQKYDRGAYPTYVLIDPEGKIVEYNTLRPSELILPQENILDRALKQER